MEVFKEKQVVGEKDMIRKFENKDIESVMNIWKNENIKAHNFIKKEYWENNYEYVKNMLPNAEVYVYEDNNEIIGFIGMNRNYIEGIFVSSDYQDKGIGTQLLNKGKENKNSLKLSVYKKNVNAINFYKKNGFKIENINLDKNTNETEYTMNWNK